ncbi:MAG: tRNA 2-thiocytidine(32) synthetase TtcA [Clostridia bacterium]|nr:tRNA 2-thiocytidine(32) synthetase TtcA [Clostridia bacterium]MBQ8369480.1 tRNA 2-thiocytidine(32) synthetase TtcA [Clostridia bacterium]
MKELQKLLSTARQATERYDMIADGDRIAVGLSGGKDSAALLLALAKMQPFYPKKYTLCAVTVNLGFPDMPLEPLRAWCESLGVAYHIENTQIAKIVFDERREKNPCALCAKLRRGALMNAVQDMGANKLALGHHLDDAAETFMMTLMHEGRIGCYSPVTVYADRGISMIRPLIYSREKDIAAVVRAENVPIVKSTCPEDGHTEREEMKKLLREFDNAHRGLYKRILGAMERRQIDGWGDFAEK